MLDSPKGLEFWIFGTDGSVSISEDAPEWAKQEFNEYQEEIDDNLKKGRY